MTSGDLQWGACKKLVVDGCWHACATGAVLVIVICFMAVTSSGASEMVAVSSLFTFDVYRRYINPKVTLHLAALLLRQIAFWFLSIKAHCCCHRRTANDW